MINQQIPFEYLTAEELKEGIAAYYPVIFAPHLRAVSDSTLILLEEYVKNGGKLIADVQFGFVDSHGKLRVTHKNNKMGKLFGGYVKAIHDTRTNNVQFNGKPIRGFYGDLEVISGKIVGTFNNGQPAIIKNNIGRGTTYFLGFDPGKMNFENSKPAIENLISSVIMEDKKSRWKCSLPMTYRITSEDADHYFILNEEKEKTATLKVFDTDYKTGEYVIGNKDLSVNGLIRVDVPEASGTWIRLEK